MKKHFTDLNKRVSTIFLRFAIAVIGAVVLALCIFALPAIWKAAASEYPGAVNTIYGIIVGCYIAAVPFFVALWESTKILGLIERSEGFSLSTVRSLRRIALCGVGITGIFIVISPLFYVWADSDDAPGLLVINMVVVGASLTVAVFAALMQRLLKQAVAMKSENDMTV